MILKILHINTSDKTGGAAIAAFRLHNAMLSSGIDSRYLVLNRTINDRKDILTVSYFDQYVKKIAIKIFEKVTVQGMLERPGLFSSFKYGIDISRHQAVLDADIIYIHWINALVNYHVLKQILKTGKPVFWFMHDMFAITGGCHHAFDCTNYHVQCVKCPYHGTGSPLTDLSRRQFKRKWKLYNQCDNLAFIAPSKWLFDCAQKSGLTRNKRIYHIPNLIDTTVFKPVSKEVSRRLFSLDIKKKIIGFGADNALQNPYKGWTYLRDALQILSKDALLKDVPIEVVIFGSSYVKEIAEGIPFPVHFLGKLYDEYSLVMVYNSVHVFVIPSLAENFPNTVLESIACDTPVVGFNVGGIPDMVNVHTGYLAEYKNSEDLARHISLLLREPRANVNASISVFAS
ncbi:MAG: glycosyltransferase, partial [Dysgonamonadaceae bacterium]|nr:glycosyltransferase [Dysgonamonadaceae bacterium]